MEFTASFALTAIHWASKFCGDNTDPEGHRPDHPGRCTALPPARHEVLSPEMQDHEDEEHLHAPEMEAVEEAAGAREVPPLGAEERQDGSAQDHPDQRRNRDDAKDINPGADPGWLPIRKEVLPRQSSFELPAGGRRPAVPRFVGYLGAHDFLPLSPDACPGKGSKSAAAKSTIMIPIKIRFGYEMRMKLQ